jgi:hypothetical protein
MNLTLWQTMIKMTDTALSFFDDAQYTIPENRANELKQVVAIGNKYRVVTPF